LLAGSSNGGHVTIHGQFDGLHIEGNLFYEASSTSNSIGISLTPAYLPDASPEYYRNCVIRHNVIVNIAQAICYGSSQDLLVENNVIFNSNTGTAAYGIIGPSEFTPHDPSDDADTRMIVNNNTIYFVNPASGSVAITMRDSTVQGMGTGCRVTNNLIHMTGTARDAFNLDNANNYTTVSNNYLSGCNWGNGQTSVTNGQNAMNAVNPGVATGNLSGTAVFNNTPSSANNWNVSVDASMTSIIGGANTTYAARLSHNGYVASGTRDIGAYESGSNPNS
jgi:hypothetical protein